MMTGQVSPILHSDVCTLLRTQARQRPWATALEAPGRPPLSYAQLYARVNEIRRQLHDAGVGRQDRVAIVLPNGPDMAIALLAVASAAAAAPLNPAYVKAEFESYFSDLNVKFLVVQKGTTLAARQVARERNIPVVELALGDDVASADADPGSPAGESDGEAHGGTPDPHDVALILLTSGSTGRSKKVPLTHRNICASVRDICRSLALTPEDRCLSMWEQFHIGGLVDLLLVPLASGGTVICAGRFDADRFFELLETTTPTWFQGVPATLHELLVRARRRGLEKCPSSLRFIRSVAAALSPQLMEEIEDCFGVPVIQTFGMTEAGPLITTNLLPPARRKPGSVGPSCGPEVAIMDASGNLLGAGECGEVVVRGDNVVSGYEGDPAANAHSFRDGWFRTGDTGYLDEDKYLFLRGRLKEMINRGGEKINPQEIDDVLQQHPAVAQAVSFSIPHRVLGEDVAVAIVLHKNGSLSEDQVRQHVGGRLSPFKVPQQVMILDELPRCPAGKVRRTALAEMLSSRNDGSSYAPPRTEMERRLAEIWGRELNVGRVGIDDNFFGLGGDSLSGVRTILAIEEALGKPLPVKALFRISTVRQMAAAIESGDDAPAAFDESPAGHVDPTLSRSDYRLMLAVMSSGQIQTVRPGSLIKVMNAGGSRPPLFWCFNAPQKEMSNLAHQLGPDQPVYGLYSGGGQLPNTPEVDAMIARHYIREIRSIQPEGPYRIGGSCRGGSVASRIATGLMTTGQTVSHLSIMEFFDHSLFDYPGKMLLLYGKQSSRFRYRAFRWGGVGWRTPFRRVPQVQWVSGPHGHFFDPAHVPTLARALEAFLNDQPLDGTLSKKAATRTILLIHRIRPLFRLYARFTAARH